MRRTVPALAVLVSLALAGCGESRKTVDLLDSLRTGETGKAAAAAESLYDDGDDALVRRMQLGLIHHLGGDLAASDKDLDQAARLVDDRRSGDPTGSILSWIANDNVTAYPGRAFEHLQVDYYRMLNLVIERQAKEGLWQPPTLLWGATTHPPVQVDTPLAPVELGDRAITAARRMTIDQLAETRDLQEGRRYDDDPFARVMAACAVYALPPGERTESDQQLAMAMLTKALAVYRGQHDSLGAPDQSFRYETAAEPAWVRALYWRHLRAYDPARFGELVAAAGGKAADHPPLADGQGMVLVLHHAGLITRPEPLQIGLAAIGTKAPEPTPEQRARGQTTTRFSWGAVGFYAKGPGSSAAAHWPVLPIPGEVVQTCLAPGGASVIGFELPAHRNDSPIPAPATLRLDDQAGGQLEVVSDLDAYARASLLDEQPRRLLKTLVRMAAKQGAVAVAAKATKESKNEYAGLLALAVNLAGSALATASESADLRAWCSLPDHVEATLVDLPVGTHRLSLTTSSGTLDLGPVRVEAGRLTVVAARTMPLTIPGSTP